MERNYDEIIADMLIKLDQNESRWETLMEKSRRSEARLDLTIKRMVKVEERLEKHDRRMIEHDRRMQEHDRKMQEHDRRMEEFDRRLTKASKEQDMRLKMQAKANTYFLKKLKEHELELKRIRNGH